MPRTSICFPRWGTQDVTKHGDDDFEKELSRWYTADESAALEGLLELKAKLRTLSTDDFWTEAVEGISRILGSEMAFVMKRLLVNDQESAVEMPPFGEPGSCLMAAALHYCTNDGEAHTIKQNKFHAYACPCAYMRHDRIFVIPEDLTGFITNNPNTIPISVDAYMAVPLFAEDKCIAHFGVMWSEKTSPKKRFSWAFVEMLLHALEDMIGQRILEGSNFVRRTREAVEEEERKQRTDKQRPSSQQQRVIPHNAISVAQSLRPYAGSLSHELRTPMQGVVGMLDVMYATVQEAVQGQDDPRLQKVFQNLKESIEVVQDSSRRAVVAADNVVHAYDMNMSVPESAHPLNEASQSPSTPLSPTTIPEADAALAVDGQSQVKSCLNKRTYSSIANGDDDDKAAKAHKLARVDAAAASWMNGSEASQGIKDGLHEAHNVKEDDKDISHHHSRHRYTPEPGTKPGPNVHSVGHHSVHRPADLRAVLQYVINEGLKTGGRPDFVTASPTHDGETIQVRSRGSDGRASQKVIRWGVDPSIPQFVQFDEKDVSKLVSCVVLNAIKFTDNTDGKVDVHAVPSANGHSISIKVSDNGPGIPKDFLPKLFKPFSQENGSLTRHNDGLGLGLMVAKGISRKLGGDLMCIRAETSAPDNGCEFEIKLPTAGSDSISRPGSPFSSPSWQRHAAPRSQPHKPPDEEYIGIQRPTITVPNPPAASRSAPKIMLELGAFSDKENETSISSTLRPSLSKLRHSNISLESMHKFEIDRDLASKHPLTFLVAEDNKINRKLLVSMLSKFGYRDVFEAHDGADAVRQIELQTSNNNRVDVILMDLWMPLMDGYEATERILGMQWGDDRLKPIVLAVTADVTDGALERAAQVGMKGLMTKPYKLHDLQRLISEYCMHHERPAVPDSVDMADMPVLTQAAITA